MERDEKQEEMERVDELVFRYQAGDEDAGEKLLWLFGCHPEQEDLGSYIGKYYKMLRYGKVNFNDRDSRRFLSLFITDKEVRNAMIPWYQYAPTTKEVRRTLQGVSDSLRIIEDDDLKQDMRVIFLYLVKRYKKINRKIFFTGYLYNSYRYYLKRHIDKLTAKKDVLTPLDMQRAPDDVAEDKESVINLDRIVLIDTPVIVIDDDLGNSWIRGLTCGEEFRELTPLQRLIIKLHAEDGYTDGDIGKKLNMHINTIHRQRKKATLYVREKVHQLIQEGYYE